MKFKLIAIMIVSVITQSTKLKSVEKNTSELSADDQPVIDKFVFDSEDQVLKTINSIDTKSSSHSSLSNSQVIIKDEKGLYNFYNIRCVNSSKAPQKSCSVSKNPDKSEVKAEKLSNGTFAFSFIRKIRNPQSEYGDITFLNTLLIKNNNFILCNSNNVTKEIKLDQPILKPDGTIQLP